MSVLKPAYCSKKFIIVTNDREQVHLSLHLCFNEESQRQYSHL